MTFLSKTTGVKGLTLIGNRNKLWIVILHISSAKCTTSWNLSNGYLSSKSTNSLNHISRYSTNRSSHRRRSVRKGVLRNFVKFIGKHLCQSLFLNKVAGLRPATLLKKRLWHRCFPANFARFLRTPFLLNTSGQLLLYKCIFSNSWYVRIVLSGTISNSILKRILNTFFHVNIEKI